MSQHRDISASVVLQRRRRSIGSVRVLIVQAVLEEPPPFFELLDAPDSFWVGGVH
jgi:hypothetical protein